MSYVRNGFVNNFTNFFFIFLFTFKIAIETILNKISTGYNLLLVTRSVKDSL